MIWRVLMVGLVAALCVPAAWAQTLVPVVPGGAFYEEKLLSFDRSSPIGEIELVPRHTVVGYSPDALDGYGAIHLTCRSDSDANQGRCPTSDTSANGAGTTKVALRFTERRSGMRTEIYAVGSVDRAFSDRRCYRDQWNNVDRPISTSFGPTCIGEPPSGTGFHLYVPDVELAKLVAGRWDADLVLDVRVLSHGPAVASFSFKLDLTITDHNAAAIYLPEFGHATPTVGLNLRYDPFAHTIGGSKQVDVCLYDGLGSQSQYLGLTVRDTSGHASGPTGFSVWHDDGGTDARRRLDYTLTLNHAGARVSLVNGHEHQLRNIDSVPLRLVMLPGMTYPVYCVPTPITFETPLVPSTSKDAGHYGGSLHVELRVPTSSP